MMLSDPSPEMKCASGFEAFSDSSRIFSSSVTRSQSVSLMVILVVLPSTASVSECHSNWHEMVSHCGFDLHLSNDQ